MLSSGFSQSQRTKLTKAGFKSVSEVLQTNPVQLAKELKVSSEEAYEIIQVAKNSLDLQAQSQGNSQSALQLLQNELQSSPIPTLCSSIDDMLGGGVQISKITEFCGAPGIGKTQIGLQLAINVQIPKGLGGIEREAIYIDTEGSFIVERVIEIAEGTIEKLKNSSQKSQVDFEAFTIESILSKIHYFRVHDYIEEIALFNVLEDFLQLHPNVKIIIVDSIAFHFRYDFSDMGLRTRLLNGVAQQLTKMADEFQLAVVLMNQMTTKINNPGNNIPIDSSTLTPALGESWGHASTHRIILFWQNSQRRAQLFKSPTQKEKIVTYEITGQGIQNVEESTLKRKYQGNYETNKRS